MKLFGFTLLRNAVKYDYCFVESLTSLSNLVEETYLALGNNEDSTETKLSSIPNLNIIHTVWDQTMRDSGLILSQQTNIALDQLKKDHIDEPGAWGIYLQADEVIHQNDYELIKKDIAFAENNGFDAVRFRYKHFWLNHNQLAVSKKWYPVEVRAIKLKTSIKSERDAQGFDGAQKIFDSNAFIYHYGHVREEQIYRLKTNDFHKLYHEDADVAKAKAKEEKKYAQSKLLPYFGPHPLVMKERIERFGDRFQLESKREIWILAQKELFAPELLQHIIALKIHWIQSVAQCPAQERKNNLIIFAPTWWQKLWYPSEVPKRSESKAGPDWTNEYVLTLKLSEKEIGVK